MKVEVMFQDIRKNKFKPDDCRVRRIAEQSAEVIEEVQVRESEPDSDDCSVADLDRTGMGLEPERTAFDDLTIDNACNSLVPIHSGVLHVLNDGGASFVCGRKRTKNYRELERTFSSYGYSSVHSVRKVAALSLDFVEVEKRFSPLHESHHANVRQHLTCVFSTRVFSDSMQTMHVNYDCEKLTRVIQIERFPKCLLNGVDPKKTPPTRLKEAKS